MAYTVCNGRFQLQLQWCAPVIFHSPTYYLGLSVIFFYVMDESTILLYIFLPGMAIHGALLVIIFTVQNTFSPICWHFRHASLQ